MPYESRLELDRLWLADFDPSVTWIAAQPMWLRSRDGTAIRRHTPDLLLTRADRSLEVVDVKPGDPAQRPKAASVFDWTAPVCETRRWRYQVWSGVDPVRLANVRTLAIGRRPGHVDLDELARLRSGGKVGMTREHGSGARPPADADDGGDDAAMDGTLDRRSQRDSGPQVPDHRDPGGVMSVIEMNVGSQVWFEGELWQIFDLSARTATVHTRAPELVDDLDDVFEKYYAEHPDQGAFEVFDEWGAVSRPS